MTNTIEKAINNVHRKLYNAMPSARFTNPEVEYLGEVLGDEFMLVTFDCHTRYRFSGQVMVSKITYIFAQAIENKRRYTSKRISEEEAQQYKKLFSK